MSLEMYRALWCEHLFLIYLICVIWNLLIKLEIFVHQNNLTMPFYIMVISDLILFVTPRVCSELKFIPRQMKSDCSSSSSSLYFNYLRKYIFTECSDPSKRVVVQKFAAAINSSTFLLLVIVNFIMRNVY